MFYHAIEFFFWKVNDVLWFEKWICNIVLIEMLRERMWISKSFSIIFPRDDDTSPDEDFQWNEKIFW